jgi:DNA-binding FadR family transcriptional regulator
MLVAIPDTKKRCNLARLQPIKVQSLKDACIEKLEGLILSGELSMGERLPAERDLAMNLNVSRPILHEALVELAARGLVTIQPRRGVYVNDYRTQGSLTLLSSLMSYNNGRIDPHFMQSMLEMRQLVEMECARLAANHVTPEYVQQLQSLLDQEKKIDRSNISALTELDFQLHLALAVASTNVVLPLLINSFKSFYTHATGIFFEKYSLTPVVDEVFTFHRQLVNAVKARNSAAAAKIMHAMLQHGEEYILLISNL